jgi:glucose/arabinose dehydrogenase
MLTARKHKQCCRPAVECLENRVTPTTLPAGFVETNVASGLSDPTAMEFAPDGRIFICQQQGDLRVVKDGTLLANPFLHLNVDSTGERGLLGIAFDPNFANNHFLYLYYTVPSPLHNRVSRFTANGDVVAAGSELPILDLDPLSATNHNGGGIHFGLDGKLYVGVGENAVGANAQSMTTRLGKMLRINSDGSIPSDNPFFNTASGDNRSIWALGLRNPFTFAVQPVSGRIFINDVGQNTWEEIDDGIAGSNYGWPTTEGPTNDPRFRGPLFAYNHGVNDVNGCAITGGTFYNPTNDTFPQQYVGAYFFADLCGNWIHRIDPATATETDFATGTTSNPVDLKVSADGGLYYLARGSGSNTGVVNRIDIMANTSPGQFVLSSASYSVGEAGGNASITVLRSGGSAGAVSVQIATGGGSAVAGVDYAAVSTTLTFADRQSSQTIAVPILQNTATGNTTFNVTLSNPGGTTLGGPATAVVTIFDDDGLATASRRFVAQAYLDLLGRAADSGGLDFWSGLLDQNMPRDQVVAAIQNSAEYRSATVQNLYIALLGRPGDPGGIAAFSAALQQGATLNDVRDVMLGSAEYLSTHGGGTPNGFLAALYFDVLGRAADPGGTAFYGQQLSSGASTRAVAAEILGSTEARQRVAGSAYTTFLRRPGDSAGLSFWLSQLQKGLREEQFLRALIASDEYFARL